MKVSSSRRICNYFYNINKYYYYNDNKYFIISFCFFKTKAIIWSKNKIIYNVNITSTCQNCSKSRYLLFFFIAVITNLRWPLLLFSVHLVCFFLLKRSISLCQLYASNLVGLRFHQWIMRPQRRAFHVFGLLLRYMPI